MFLDAFNNLNFIKISLQSFKLQLFSGFPKISNNVSQIFIVKLFTQSWPKHKTKGSFSFAIIIISKYMRKNG